MLSRNDRYLTFRLSIKYKVHFPAGKVLGAETDKPWRTMYHYEEGRYLQDQGYSTIPSRPISLGRAGQGTEVEDILNWIIVVFLSQSPSDLFFWYTDHPAGTGQHNVRTAIYNHVQRLEGSVAKMWLSVLTHVVDAPSYESGIIPRYTRYRIGWMSIKINQHRGYMHLASGSS